VNGPGGDLNVEPGGGWSGLPRKSTPVETSFINTHLNLYKSLLIELLLSSATFKVV
jgi:hypothetical protein